MYNNELLNDDYSVKTFVHNTRLQIFADLHYFGELIPIGMRQDMADETVDSKLVKDGRIKIPFLFHSNCVLSQCRFYKKIMIPYTLKISIWFSSCVSLFFTEKIGFDLTTSWIRVHFLPMAMVNIMQSAETVSAGPHCRKFYYFLSPARP